MLARRDFSSAEPCSKRVTAHLVTHSGAVNLQQKIKFDHFKATNMPTRFTYLIILKDLWTADEAV